MLRITQETIDESRVLLRLEGSVVGPWAAELLNVGKAALSNGDAEIDLQAVTLIDARGAEALRSLRTSGARLLNASEFVNDLLRDRADED